jgi:hypothetical protein
MNAVTSTRDLRPVCKLLGGSGRARASTVPVRLLPILLRPSISAPLSTGRSAC